MSLEGDIGGGLILVWDVFVVKNNFDIVSINFRIEVRLVGVGLGGFLRLVCFWVYLLMKLVNFLDFVIKFIDINGDYYEFWVIMEFGEYIYEGIYRLNGELVFI